MNHQHYMKRAFDLAQQAEGRTSPNPMVGAVIVKNNQIIGEGYHKKAGGPHAEIEALRAATETPENATIYVTLEPCCIYGKTPPCSKALIEAGIAEVHYAVPDPNPKVSGGGHKQLETAGIRVFSGPMEEEGHFLNRAFFRYITSGRSYVTAKYAMSLDGKIATRTGESQWITGPSARKQGHRLRNTSDAILVGAGTVLADNPRLTTRLEEAAICHHPVRVLLDSSGRVPLDRAIYDQSLPGRTILATTDRVSTEHRAQLEAKNVELLVVAANRDGRVALEPLLRALAQRNLVRVMVEGGAEVLGAFHDKNLIDEAWVFIGSKLIGGQGAPGPLAGMGIEQITQTTPFSIYEGMPLDGDFLIKAVHAERETTGGANGHTTT